MATRSRETTGSKMEPASNSVPTELTDDLWSLISDLFVDPKPDPRGGRPRVEPRRCIEGILWILRSGARWKDLPRSFPSYATCWRRFEKWTAEGTWETAWRRLVGKLDRAGEVDWEEGYADGTFASAKKGVIASDRPSAAKVRSSWCSSTAEACRSPSM